MFSSINVSDLVIRQFDGADTGTFIHDSKQFESNKESLSIRSYSIHYKDQVLALSIDHKQEQFAGNAKDFIGDQTSVIDHKLIFLNETLIGVFKLDNTYKDHYDFCGPESLGLRSLFIDKRHQGKGYGIESMRILKDYLMTEYRQYNSLYLTVNIQNPGARACYKKAGFIDKGDVYLGGLAGPQNIMQLNF